MNRTELTDEPMSPQKMIELARKAAEQAYAPYSGYRVGAALLTSSGHLFTGCNVENASYGLALCAERNAITSAVAAGEREFTAIAIAAGTDVPGIPCGACLQVMAEFCKSDFVIHTAMLAGCEIQTRTLQDYLPFSFHLTEKH